MKSDTKLIIISKSKFCFVPELHSNERIFKKLNSFSEQLRYEMINQTMISEQAKERLINGMNLTENIENAIWNAILEGIEYSQINVLDLGSTYRIELFAKQLKRKEHNFQIHCINLELSEPEFARRCEQTLTKGNELSMDTILSFANKYQSEEIKRQMEIAQIKQNNGIQFVKYEAEKYETNIIGEQINNSL
jgi:hypothetical protein